MMSLTAKGKKGNLIRKKLALAMAANASISKLKPDVADEKSGASGAAKRKETPIHGSDSAERNDTKYSLEGRRRFGFRSGTEEGETLVTQTVSQPVRSTVLSQATKIPQKSPELGRASLIPQKLDKSDQNSTESKNRGSKATVLNIEESKQRYDHSVHASNDFVSQNMSIKVHTFPEASHATPGPVTQLDRSRNEAGHTTGMNAGVSSFRDKNDKPKVTPSRPTDINAIEKEVSRLKFDIHKMLEDFQNLNAFTLHLEKQVEDVRKDRQKMTS